MGQPQIGDLIISRPSAVFRSNRSRHGWTQPRSHRDLYNPQMPTYMIDNEHKSYMDAEGTPGRKYPARIFSRSRRRNKRPIWIDGKELVNVNNAYTESEREGRNVWLWMKPNQPRSTKYMSVYDQWLQEQNPACDRMWKMNLGESRIYGHYPVEEE